uniref:hypothetical protein n=1 Tax=Acetatifactor sp. TaxID=1872090 RepID=UPI00405799E3
MMELLESAWPGWLQFTSGGKIVALLLLALIIYWFARNNWKDYWGALGTYATIMTVCCICPLTATVLMEYQTRFYHYQWIWNLVPITIVVAFAATLLWTELMERCSKRKNSKGRMIAITFGLVGVICISGGMGAPQWEPEKENAKCRETLQVLEALQQYSEEPIVLWAPQPIMEYARAVDGRICLPYGRNMWDITLNAYTYDVYGADEKDLYAWMCNAEIYGTENENLTVTSCADLARNLGVTHILLPGIMQPEILTELEDYLDVKAENLEGYYLFCL